MGQPTPVPQVVDFKSQFQRDFSYGTGTDTVTDNDIQNALNMASSVYNPTIFDATLIGAPGSLTSEAILAYLYASAHFLVLNVQASGGLAAPANKIGALSGGSGVITNKSVGGVSVGQSWPDEITNDKMLFQFTRTQYGEQYLQMLSTKLVGNVQLVLGQNQLFENQNQNDV